MSGKAEQISYAALKELENIPEDFLHLTLRFVADNTVLTEQEFNYGDSFSGGDISPGTGQGWILYSLGQDESVGSTF
ncbi:MAG: hypothetical protein ACLSHU_14420 [Oscillospiraceae bacterium]